MGILDGPMRAVAKTLIGVLGADLVLIRVSKGYEPTEGTTVSQDPEEWEVKCTPPESANTNEAYDTFGAAGSVITKGDLMTHVAAEALEDAEAPVPVVGMKVRFGSTEYRIKDVAYTRAGDLVTLYTLLCGI
jgi:hypothetical protein